MNPIILTHYCSNESKPLMNILNMDASTRDRLSEELSQIKGRAYGRFQNMEWYLPRRIAIEKWMHDEFLNLGGRPQTCHPLYFIVGESDFLRTGYGDHCRQIAVSLDDIPDDEISFTMSDSLAMYVSETEKKLYTKSMLLAFMDNDDGKIAQLNQDRKFVEAQIWRKHL